MPLIFIHGVNTRETDPGYESDRVARNELIRRLVLAPLATKGARYRSLEIVDAYWGKDGVDFAWGQASLPEVRVLESLGGDDETWDADLEFAMTVRSLAGSPAGTSDLEPLGTGDCLLKRAAQKDLTRFLEAVIGAVILSEQRLDASGEASPEQEGAQRGLVGRGGL